jgi:hypothetical protein
MNKVFRPSVPVGSCTTLSEKSVELGGTSRMLHQHRQRGADGFPKPVAHIGGVLLFVDAELDAFYQSVIWRQADRAINELTGEGV